MTTYYFFRIVFVPEELLIEEDELSTPECGDIGTRIIGVGDTEDKDDKEDTDLAGLEEGKGQEQQEE